MYAFSKRLLPILLLLPMSVLVFAEVPRQATNGEREPVSGEESDDIARFAVNVNLVNLFFEVTDKHDVPVRNLVRDDFEVFENGRAQKIRYFKADATQPLTLGLLIDTSSSTRRILPLDGFPDTRNGSRGTLLYDAIFLAATEELQHEVGRKALVAITDGVDQGSQTSLAATIEAAQRSDTSVYVLLAYDRVFGARSEDVGRICKQTGGRVIEVGEKPGGVEKAIQQISEELRGQYYIGYTPTLKPDGSFRKLEVRVKSGDYHVQVRKGYYAPKQ
jgi:hypothetical protein